MYKPEVLSQFGISNNFALFPKKVCIFIDGIWFDHKEYKEAEYRVFIGGCEPYDFTDRYYTQQKVIDNKDKFDLILTSNDTVVESCKHAVLFPFGTRRITESFKKEQTYFEVSFLCGVKRELEGHILRHKIFSSLHRINHMGVKSVYTTNNNDKKMFGVSGKDYIFNTSQFSIIVENSRYRNYFTEKIIDSFLSKTIPFYWGCPNINDYFDGRGIIKFDNIDDLYAKVSMLTPEIYESKKEILEINYNKAKQYENFFERVNKIINEKIYG